MCRLISPRHNIWIVNQFACARVWVERARVCCAVQQNCALAVAISEWTCEACTQDKEVSGQPGQTTQKHCKRTLHIQCMNFTQVVDLWKKTFKLSKSSSLIFAMFFKATYMVCVDNLLVFSLRLCKHMMEH